MIDVFPNLELHQKDFVLNLYIFLKFTTNSIFCFQEEYLLEYNIKLLVLLVCYYPIYLKLNPKHRLSIRLDREEWFQNYNQFQQVPKQVILRFSYTKYILSISILQLMLQNKLDFLKVKYFLYLITWKKFFLINLDFWLKKKINIYIKKNFKILFKPSCSNNNIPRIIIKIFFMFNVLQIFQFFNQLQRDEFK